MAALLALAIFVGWKAAKFNQLTQCTVVPTGILRNGKTEQGHRADQNHQNGDDVREHRPLDEEF